MFFVFDVETIPDFDLLRSTLAEPSADDDELLIQASEELTRNQSGFLPPMFHRLVSWAGLWIENNGRPKMKSSWNGQDEIQGLHELFSALHTFKDYGLIHHNGRGFDLPLLTYRAMKYGLQMPARLSHHEIRYRYSHANIDLMDEFSNYGASSYPKLKHLGHLIGMPFKQTAEGNEVLDMYRRGELEKIEHYCYEDVMATYIVWLQMRYTTGDIQEEEFANLKERAFSKLQEIQAKPPA
jgi:3'-5' exonuclease